MRNEIRLTTAKFVVFALISALFFLLIYNTMQDNVNGKLVKYDAVFSDVSGLREGDNIRVAGVQVGKVKSIEVDGRQAHVDFELKESQPLLTNTRLVMRYQNLLGQRYLALDQPAQRGEPMKAGSTVPLSRTDPGFDLTQLLNGFRPLFDVLNPADVNQLARTVVQVLQGEGGTVAELLQQTTKLTNFLADRDEIVGQVLTNLTPVLQNLNGQGDEIRTTVRELKALMSGLARQRDTVGTSIEQMSTLIDQASDFLVDARDPSVQLVRSLRATSGMFSGNLDALQAAVQAFPKLLATLGRVTSYESSGNVYLCKLQLEVLNQKVLVGPANGPYSEVCSR